MLKYSLLSLLVLSLLIIITSCNQSEPQIQQSNLNDAPEFLLIADEDPLNIEQDEAFIIDGAGPLYFWILDLTDEQKEQIKEIVSEFRSDFVELCGRWNSGLSWEEIKEERQALREKIREAIYEILTDEQKAILDEIKTQIERGKYPDILVERRVAFLTEQLDLTTEQQNQVAELYKEYGNLLIASRNESGNRFEFMMAKRELFMELDGKIKVLLTVEQLELYEELKFQHRKRRFHHFHRTAIRT